MPDNEMDLGKYPNREWFWQLAFTIIPEWADSYALAVNINRNAMVTKKPNETKVITVSQKWQDKLKVHDFKS